MHQLVFLWFLFHTSMTVRDRIKIWQIYAQLHPEQQQMFFNASKTSLKRFCCEKVLFTSTFESDIFALLPWEEAKDMGVDVIFVITRSVVGVSLDPIKVLDHVTEWGQEKDFSNKEGFGPKIMLDNRQLTKYCQNLGPPCSQGSCHGEIWFRRFEGFPNSFRICDPRGQRGGAPVRSGETSSK